MSRAFDLIIIGLGINGAAIARDAAMRGLRVVAIDQGDIGAETSARNSRLIHGGLRYLEHMEFGLVRESLRERDLLLRHAPHLVRPLRLTIPVYRGAKRGKWTIRAGLALYDLLSGRRSVGRHTALSRNQALSLSNGALREEGLTGAASYWDAQVEFPERLCLEIALSARTHGAELHTWTRADDLLIDAGRVVAVRCSDVLTGEPFELHAPVVVNAAGPWVDRVLNGKSERLVGGTKGTHIVLRDISGLPRDRAWYAEAGSDGRPFFVIPWGGRWLVGTTDTRYDADPGEAAGDADDAAYLLNEVNRLFPGAGLGPRDIEFTWSGVRALPYAPGAKPGKITRKHLIIDHAPGHSGLLSIVGGKLTTHRSLAEECVDRVCDTLGSGGGCRTQRGALPGALRGPFAALTERIEQRIGDKPFAERLASIYGVRALDVVALAEEEGSLDDRVCDEPPVLAAEVGFALRHEFARTLGDVVLRRLMLTPGGAGFDAACERIAERMRLELGWSSDETDRQRDLLARELERLAVPTPAPEPLPE